MSASLAGVRQAVGLVWRAGPHLICGSAVLTFIQAGLPVAVAWLIKVILDVLASGQPTGPGLVGSLAGLVVAGLVAAGLPHLSSYLEQELRRRVYLLAQDRLFAATERLPGLARFENPVFLDRLVLAQTSGSATPAMVLDALLGIGSSAIVVVGFLGSLLLISPWLALVVALSAGPALMAELYLSRIRAAMLWRISPIERREHFYQRLLTNLAALKELRLFGTGRYFRESMTHQRRQANAQQRAMDRREVVIQTWLGLLAAGVAGGGLVWAVLAAASGRITVGDVSLLVAALAGVQGAVTGLVGQLAQLHHQLLMFDHYLAVTASQTDLTVPAAPTRLPPLRRGIEVRGVWFRYSPDHPWAIRDVSLTIPHGRAVALVGRNGAGKSTLIKLLCRFYDPQRGSIHWDGIDLRELDPAELRQRIGAVFQDYMEYDLSAADNIGLGDVAHRQDRTRITAAAQRAGVHDRLAALPQGYDTILSRIFFGEDHEQVSPNDPEVGVMLSGGQWQRVALARAFMRDRRDLLILDEPSSGLDAEAEYEVHARLRAHRAGQTSILISHRLGAIRDADTLVVLDQGRIVEQGTHSELACRHGLYAQLFDIQARGYQPNGASPSQ